MTKKRKITKQQYERAKQIVSEYESQSSLSFVRGRFSIDDLEISHHSIGVPKLILSVFDDDYCTAFYHSLIDVENRCDWACVDDVGFLTIGFRNMTIDDKQINSVLGCLNAL